MPCDLTQGLSGITCRDNTGGIATVYLTELANIDTITYDTDGSILTFSMDVGTQFWEYAQLKQTSEWEENFKTVAENGTFGWDQLLKIRLFKRDSNKRKEIQLLAQNTLVAIVKDMNTDGSGNPYYWLLGEVRGLDLADGSKYTSGKNVSDLNGWDLSFAGAEAQKARQVLYSLIPILIQPAT